MVGVTGFEPAASTSQMQKHRFFASFCVLFRAFSSEICAFLYRKVHNSHVVRCCKWSRLWSDLNPILLSPPRTSRKLQPEVDFYWNHYTIKSQIFQVPSRLNICTAVIKDYDAASLMHILGYSKTRFRHIFGNSTVLCPKAFSYHRAKIRIMYTRTPNLLNVKNNTCNSEKYFQKALDKRLRMCYHIGRKTKNTKNNSQHNR